MRKVGYHRILLPDGTIEEGPLVVELDEGDNYLSHHSLKGEEPFVEWRGGVYEIKK